MSWPTLRVTCAYTVPVLAVIASATVARWGGALAAIPVVAFVAGWQALLLRARLQADRLARLDALTGLPDRAVLRDKLRQRGADVGMVFVDLDRFKDVNDTYGHVAGDRVLVEVAHRLQQAAGRSATFARYGGDEFAVLVPASATATVAEDIANALRRPIDSVESLRLSASVGAAVRVGLGGGELIADADAAMYRAKRAGMWTHVPYAEMRPALA
ncbi:MAG: GGDEF domain-containing protein [Jiangellaceae bacterium]|nr:GGDEF domain-containing protein [Jiangellaceae bacterium]